MYLKIHSKGNDSARTDHHRQQNENCYTKWIVSSRYLHPRERVEYTQSLLGKSPYSLSALFIIWALLFGPSLFLFHFWCLVFSQLFLLTLIAARRITMSVEFWNCWILKSLRFFPLFVALSTPFHMLIYIVTQYERKIIFSAFQPYLSMGFLSHASNTCWEMLLKAILW